jgi:hypothetical protein
MSMYQANRTAKWNTRNNYNSNTLGVSYDKKIDQLTWSTISWEDVSWKIARTLIIDTTNKNDIDLSWIIKPQKDIIIQEKKKDWEETEEERINRLIDQRDNFY